jgi:hypothetical protein
MLELAVYSGEALLGALFEIFVCHFVIGQPAVGGSGLFLPDIEHGNGFVPSLYYNVSVHA